MRLENSLKVWGEDKTEGKVLAKNYYCVNCYDSKKEVGAEVFWPAFDPDIKSFPYCRPCVEELKLRAMIDFFGID